MIIQYIYSYYTSYKDIKKINSSINIEIHIFPGGLNKNINKIVMVTLKINEYEYISYNL